jgi:diaminopropionate ammonia-lyase
MRALVNPRLRPDALPSPDADAIAFHMALDRYAPTPVHDLPGVAAELGLGAVALKDESDRLGLPAFKALGASWAIERALRERPGVHTLVAASTGNHGRAVAHEAARRGLRCRVFLPASSVGARRDAIAGEGAELVVVDGTYEDAIAAAAVAAAAGDGAIEIADVGAFGAPRWVIDGYATMFHEIAEQGRFDIIVVPTGVGALAAAAARFAAREPGTHVVGVEPVGAACVTASLLAGEAVTVQSAGTTMAGLDCGTVSAAAWPELRDGVHGTVTVTDPETHAAMRELAAGGLRIGDSGASGLAALRVLASAQDGCAGLRDAVGFGADTRVLLLGTEGATDPAGYEASISLRNAAEL